VQITEAKWFEIFILLAITGTCVSLAVYTPLPNGDTNATNEFMEDIEVHILHHRLARYRELVVLYSMVSAYTL
jgi:hypothetical protein